MNKPTKEEVEKMKRRLARNGLDCVLPNEVESLADAYLAQGESLVNERLRRKQEYWEGREVIDRLEAENQALKERYDKLEQSSQQIITDMAIEAQALKASMEAEYIERQSEHIQELVKENEALKDKLAKAITYGTPQKAEPLGYHIDEEDTWPNIKGGYDYPEDNWDH